MDIKLTFMGAARGVTGSRYLIEANDKTILVDCGLYQEREFQSRNWEAFRCAPDKLHAVLITHAHLDHCGLLPKLVNEGFKGRVYCTPATADITKIILLDSAHIQEEDAAYKKKRHIREGRKGPFPEIPLYTTADAEATFPLFTRIEYNNTVEIAPGIEATFFDAGHVLGSSMIKVRITQGEEKRSIVFSGDLGRWDRPMLNDPRMFRYTDYIVMESTYGDRQHPDKKEIDDELEEIIKAAFAAGGNIIVPSFALQRAQEILYYLNILLMEKRIQALDVYVDSPMAIRITEVFKRYSNLFDQDMKRLLKEQRSPFDFPGLKMVQTVDESKALNKIMGTIMIIAGSGMCTGGRVKHHLVNNISRPECTVMFVGYQAIGTLGRLIVDGAKTVRIHGKRYPVRAKITQVQGFSAHADRDDLLKWLSKLEVHPKRIFITHGETKSAEEFAKFLKESTGYDTLIPDYATTVNLE
ncbi:MAG: MBL fold metallo-hydrolase [Dehalococcoidales bacterium]|nr:MBL fold metallo-hydrolase [Dehalococcoidales bacterium]